jgi:hypothetical protein
VIRRELLDPFRHGFYALQLLSHKILRRLVVFPLLILLFVTPLLWSRGPIYQLAAIAQVAFYGAAALHVAVARTRLARFKLLSLPFFFCTVNAAALSP